jgi:hypothetical protein
LVLQEAAEDATKRFEDTREDLERFMSEQQNAASKPSKSVSKKPLPAPDSEIEHEVPERRTARRGRGTTPASEVESIPEIPNPRAKGVKKPKPKVITPIREEEEVTPEDPPLDEESDEKEAVKPKPKPRNKGKAKATEATDGENTSPVKPKRKRKALADPDDAEQDYPNKKAANVVKKPETKPGSTSRDPEDRVNIEADPLPKAKRKKTLFAGSQPSQSMSFNFASNVRFFNILCLEGTLIFLKNQYQSDGAFNIPTSLLPVEESDGPVPKRAIISTLSNMMVPVIRSRMAGK